MPFAEIVVALHFREAADGALELEIAIASGIKPVGFGVGRGEQFDGVVVERVD